MENTGKPGKCILVCAGHFDEPSLPREAGDFLIAADNGLAYLKKIGAEPDLILGDFDSLEEEDRPLLEKYADRVLRLPVEKDDTDSLAAAREGLRRGYRHFVLYGAAGGSRLDHTLANLQTLLFLKRSGADAVMIDGGTQIRILENEELHFPAGTRGGFSVFALEKEGCSLTIRGMYYEAQNLPLCNDYPIGVSNSFLPEKEATVLVRGTPALAVIRYERQAAGRTEEEA